MRRPRIPRRLHGEGQPRAVLGPMDPQLAAGQYDTVLDVHGADAVLVAVTKCVASASSERLALYGRPVRPMAVLVQQMVDASASGVAF